VAARGSTNGASPWVISKAMSKPATRGTLRRDSALGSGTVLIAVPAGNAPAAEPTAAPRTTGRAGMN